MVSEDRLSAGFSRRQTSQEAVEFNGVDSDGDAQSLAEVSEPGSFDGIDPLLGTRLTTSFGHGCIEEIHQFEDTLYCIIRLSSFGTLSLPQDVVEAMLRKEKKLAPQQGTASSRSTARLQNLRGNIRMYNPAKGWGFIVCDEFEGDIFLHSKHMVGNLPREYIGHFQSSQEGHQVKFDLDLVHRNRPQALNVRVVSVTEQDVAVYPKSRRPRSRNEKGAAAATVGEGSDLDEDFAGDEPFDAAADYDAEFDSRGDGGVTQAADTGDTSVDAGPPCATPAGANAEEGAGAPWQYCVSTPGGGIGVPLGRKVVQLPDKRKGVLRMRGLPFSVTPSDVAAFFDGYGVRAEDVTLGQRTDGSPNGEACVVFARDELAEKARKERHMHHMGHRYIELFNAKGPAAGADAEVDPEAATPLSQPAAGGPGNFESTGYPAHVAEQPPLANPPSYPPNTPATAPAASVHPPSNPVSAGAVPPPPSAAAAAAQHAVYAAAMHASSQGLQGHGHAGQSLALHIPSPWLPPAQDGTAVSGAAPQVGDVEPAVSAQQQQTQAAYEHYFRYFQQAYAAAIASQAVQAYAAAAAQQYQQQQQLQPPPPAAAGVKTPSADLEQLSSFNHNPVPSAVHASPPSANAPAAADATATAAAATAAPVEADVEAIARDPSLFSSSLSPHSFDGAVTGGAPGLDFAMGAPGLDEVYVAQPRWQHYHEI